MTTFATVLCRCKCAGNILAKNKNDGHKDNEYTMYIGDYEEDDRQKRK